MTAYIELQVQAEKLYSEMVGEILLSFGCNGIVLSEEDFKDGKLTPSTNYVKTYLALTKDNEALIPRIEHEIRHQHKYLLNDGLTETDLGSWILSYTIVNEEDWAESWKKFWKPQRIGENFVICPSWENFSDVKTSDILINLDPGAAFGTGSHPTTRLCLVAIEKYFANQPKKDISVLDVGTGSGILAVGAAKMGAQKVFGFDIDPVSVDVSKENAEKNNCLVSCTFEKTSIYKVHETYDLVIVNILARVILSIGEEIKRVTKPKGTVILSGLLANNLEPIMEMLKDVNLTVEEVLEEEGWAAIIAKNV